MAVGVVLLSAVDPLAGYAAERTIDIKHLGEGQSIVRVDAQAKYLLLPVEESSPESKLYMIVDNDVVRTFNVRLAVNKVDYFVPVDLSGYADKHISFNFQLAPESALCWKEMKLSDQFDSSNREKFRPAYHFSPAWGWMNDPNGMVSFVLSIQSVWLDVGEYALGACDQQGLDSLGASTGGDRSGCLGYDLQR